LRKHIAELVPFKKVYYIDEEKGASVEEMIERYENIINEGPIDVVCMGIGENGHVAFNDPPVADFNDPELIKLVELDDACRRQQVNDGCFPDFASTPTHALTLTIPALARGAVQVCAVRRRRQPFPVRAADRRRK
jgi:glucosamine-6-phosphate deaminase